MKTNEPTLDALIKQINSQKQTGSNTVSKALSLLNQRMTMAENAIQSDIFKEATTLIYDANTELMQAIYEIKRLRTPWWKKLFKEKALITPSCRGKCHG